MFVESTNMSSDATRAQNANNLVQRLYRENPLFHFADERGARRSAELGYNIPPNAEFSMAVTPPVLRWIANHLRQDMITLETGAGYTTVVFAALAAHHHCCTVSEQEVEKISTYLTHIGVPASKVTFHVGRTDETLPRLDLGQVVDFAYIDGCHGYPYPALDWHYIDGHLKIGGLLGMDNAELRPVREHCEFLEEDGSYKLEHVITDVYFVRLYRKLRDEHREWIYQPYSLAKKDPCDGRLITRLKRKASRWIKPHLF